MLEKQRKGTKEILLTNAHVQMNVAVFCHFLKKEKSDKMSAVTYLSNTEPGHFMSFNEKLMNHEAAFLELVQCKLIFLCLTMGSNEALNCKIEK